MGAWCRHCFLKHVRSIVDRGFERRFFDDRETRAYCGLTCSQRGTHLTSLRKGYTAMSSTHTYASCQTLSTPTRHDRHCHMYIVIVKLQITKKRAKKKKKRPFARKRRFISASSCRKRLFRLGIVLDRILKPSRIVSAHA